MREALGIETDTPTNLTNPAVIGSGNGSLAIANGRPNLQQGVAFFTGRDGTGAATASAVYVNDPTVDNNYRNAVITPTVFGFQQASTGTNFPFAQFTNGSGQIALTAKVGAIDAVTANSVDVVDLTVTTVNGSAYPPTTTVNNTAATGAYTFATIPAYPTTIWYDTIQNRVPLNKKFLLTMCLNFILTPTAPFVGYDRINVRCGQSTGSPANPANNFAEPNLDLIYPDGTTYASYPFTVINQVELVSDAMGQWSVILEAVGGTHNYSINGTAGVLSITELFS